MAKNKLSEKNDDNYSLYGVDRRSVVGTTSLSTNSTGGASIPYAKTKKEGLIKLFNSSSDEIENALAAVRSDLKNSKIVKLMKILDAVRSTEVKSTPDQKYSALSLISLREILDVIKSKSKKLELEDIKKVVERDREYAFGLFALNRILDAIQERIESNSKKKLLKLKTDSSSLEIQTLESDTARLIKTTIKDTIADMKKITTGDYSQYREYKKQIEKLNGENPELNKELVYLALTFNDDDTVACHMKLACNENNRYVGFRELVDPVYKEFTKNIDLYKTSTKFNENFDLYKKLTTFIMDVKIESEGETKNQANIYLLKLYMNYARLVPEVKDLIKDILTYNDYLNDFQDVDSIRPLREIYKEASSQNIKDKVFKQVIDLIFKEENKEKVKKIFEEDTKYKDEVQENPDTYAKLIYKNQAVKCLWWAKAIMSKSQSDSPLGIDAERILKIAVSKDDNIYEKSEELEILFPLVKVYCEKQMLPQVTKILEKCYTAPVDVWDKNELTSKLMGFADELTEPSDLSFVQAIFNTIYKRNNDLEEKGKKALQAKILAERQQLEQQRDNELKKIKEDHAEQKVKALDAIYDHYQSLANATELSPEEWDVLADFNKNIGGKSGLQIKVEQASKQIDQTCDNSMGVCIENYAKLLAVELTGESSAS